MLLNYHRPRRRNEPPPMHMQRFTGVSVKKRLRCDPIHLIIVISFLGAGMMVFGLLTTLRWANNSNNSNAPGFRLSSFSLTHAPIPRPPPQSCESEAMFRLMLGDDHELVRAAEAARLKHRSSNLFLQYLDSSYLEMTKSFLCNVKSFPVVERFIFVTIDARAHEELRRFGRQVLARELTVVLLSYDVRRKTNASGGGGGGGGLEYGTYEYFDLMLMRTGINYQLLRRGFNVFLTESDAVWTEDISRFVISQVGDVVTLADSRIPHQEYPGVIITHGYSLFRATQNTLTIYCELLAQQFEAMNSGREGEEGNEQVMFSSLAGGHPEVRIRVLDPGLFYNGLKFSYFTPIDDNLTPLLRHNNYIAGNGNKVRRAKKYGFWFYDEASGACT